MRFSAPLKRPNVTFHNFNVSKMRHSTNQKAQNSLLCYRFNHTARRKRCSNVGRLAGLFMHVRTFVIRDAGISSKF